MGVLADILKPAVTAFLLWPVAAPLAGAQESVDQLLQELADPDRPDWQRVESDLQRAWSKSGSAAMDLLLKRGQDALEAGDTAAAIEHLTALTDHAPDFAEGWNARATAFFMADRYGPSVADIQHTLALNPNHYGALAGLGLIFAQVDRKQQAMAAFRASLAINPHQDQIREALTQLERETGGQEL